MGTSLAAGDCVDLVDDDGVDTPQRLTSLTGQQEEQRLRRRDEDVRWPARERSPLVGGSVTCPHADLHLADCLAEARRSMRDAREWRAKVALDVDGERLQRGDVEDPAAGERVVGWGCGQQPVDRVEEGRECL